MRVHRDVAKFVVVLRQALLRLVAESFEKLITYLLGIVTGEINHAGLLGFNTVGVRIVCILRAIFNL